MVRRDIKTAKEFFMKTKRFFSFGLLAVLLALGLVLIGCDTDSGDENTDPKVLEITNISQSLASKGSNGIQIGIFPAGTTIPQAMAQAGIVAGASTTDVTLSNSAPYTCTAPLYAAPFSSGNRWTGSGTYDVYLVLGNNEYYQKTNVSFTSASTSVNATSFLLVGGRYDSNDG
jgi:hypothetical protein